MKAPSRRDRKVIEVSVSPRTASAQVDHYREWIEAGGVLYPPAPPHGVRPPSGSQEG